MSARFWTRETIIAAIRKEYHLGHPLNYASMQERVPALLRAAERVYGSWSTAIAAAGFDYSEIRCYKIWTRDRVLSRIRMWHEKGADLSWRHVTLHLDPQLGAAALHANRFTSWTEALTQAGLNPTEVARYRHWTLPMIQQELERLSAANISMEQDSLAREAPDLRAAIYRIKGGKTAQRNALKRQQHH